MIHDGRDGLGLGKKSACAKGLRSHPRVREMHRRIACRLREPVIHGQQQHRLLHQRHARREAWRITERRLMAKFLARQAAQTVDADAAPLGVGESLARVVLARFWQTFGEAI